MAVRRRVVGSRRLTSWFFIGPLSATLTAAGGTLLSSLNAAALALRPFTIVRTYIDLIVRSDQSAAVEFQGGAIGVAVVSDEAVAVGVSAVPTPITQMGSDLWMLHGNFLAGHSDLTDRSNPVGVFHYDSKAMRKVEEGQDVAVIAELSTTLSSGFIIGALGRMLIKTN